MERQRGAEVGVLTVIDPEIRAVVAVLRQMDGFQQRCLRHGTSAYQAWLPDRWGRKVRVAAVQSARPGPDAAVRAYRGLVEEYNPATVLLVGVAAGAGEDVRIGDVVIGNQVILGGSPDLGRGLGALLAAFPGGQLSFGLHHGPIGTELRENVLAVESKSAGVARLFHESFHRDNVRGRLTICGISGTTGAVPGHAGHPLAAGRAAVVMAMLLPYLYFDEHAAVR